MQARTTLFLALSGRHDTWPLLAAWLDQQTYPKSRLSLVLLDSARDDWFSAKVQDWIDQCDYQDVRHIRRPFGPPGLADLPRRRNRPLQRRIRRTVAAIYNWAVDLTETDYLWFVEDDVIPPLAAGRHLHETLTRSDATLSASGAYPAKYHPGYEAAVWTDNGARPLRRPGRTVQRIGANGFGCVLFRRDHLKQTRLHNGPPAGRFDRNLYRWAQDRNLAAWLDWRVQCAHLTAGRPIPFLIVAPNRYEQAARRLAEGLSRHFAVDLETTPLPWPLTPNSTSRRRWTQRTAHLTPGQVILGKDEDLANDSLWEAALEDVPSMRIVWLGETQAGEVSLRPPRKLRERLRPRSLIRVLPERAQEATEAVFRRLCIALDLPVESIGEPQETIT